MWPPELYRIVLDYLHPCERAAHDDVHTFASYNNAVEIGHLEYLRKHRKICQNFDHVITLAIKRDQLPVIQLFINEFKMKLDKTQLNLTITYGRIEMAKIVVDLYDQSHALLARENGQTEIMEVIEKNQVIVKGLPNFTQPGELDRALCNAAGSNDIPLIKALAAMGATDFSRAMYYTRQIVTQTLLTALANLKSNSPF